jgi:molybdopterin converting factor small subunit
MKVNLFFEGIPAVAKVVGKRAFEFDLGGQTVADLLVELINEYGENIKKILWDESSNFDPSVQIVINQRDYVQIDKMAETQLSEGDTVVFITLLNGG